MLSSQLIPDYVFRIIDLIPIPAFIKNREGIFLHCNKAFVEYTQISESHIIGKSTHEIMPQELAVIYTEMDRKTLELKNVQIYEAPLQKSDGRRVETAFFKTALTASGGEVLGIACVMTNIAQHKLTEEILDRYELILNHTRDSILIIDPATGAILESNASAANTYGYTRSELKQIKVYDLRQQAEEPAIKQQLSTALASGLLFETTHKRKDNTTFPVQVSSSGTKIGGKTVLVSIIRNITDWTELRDELKVSNDHLKQKNLEIEKTLHNLKLTQASLIQQEKLAGIGQLAAGVAHEINNPLGYVCSNIDTLKKYVSTMKEIIYRYQQLHQTAATDSVAIRQNLSEVAALEKQLKLNFIAKDIDELINESADGLQRMSDIVKGLRVFSRIDLQGSSEQYSLNDGLDTTLLVARNEIKYVANVQNQYDADLPLVEATGNQINQVLLNIIMNAVHAINAKNPTGILGTIQISTYHDDNWVYCKISDDGIGIPKDHLNKLFEPFFTTKPVGQGTGLGLSISYDIIVNKHFGTIEVDSEVGKGTTIIIKLPVISPDIGNTLPGLLSCSKEV